MHVFKHIDKFKFSVYPMRELLKVSFFFLLQGIEWFLLFFFYKELSEANEKLQQEVDDKVIFKVELG